MKFIRIFFVLIIFAVVGAIVSGFIVDNMIASNIEAALNDIPVPQGTTIEASISKAGKITTTDGGLQFYGAILLQSTQGLGALRSYYKSRQPEGIDLDVINLKDSKLMLGENMPDDLRFSYRESNPSNCYIVYAWGEPQLPFTMFDIRSYT